MLGSCAQIQCFKFSVSNLVFHRSGGSCVVYEPLDRYVGRHIGRDVGRGATDMSTDISADVSTDMSLAMLTDRSRSIYRPSVGRHVGR